MNLPASFKTEIYANPYRDWALILGFLFFLIIVAAVIDARFFLSATRPLTAEQDTAVLHFDKDKLEKAVIILVDRDKEFSGR